MKKQFLSALLMVGVLSIQTLFAIAPPYGQPAGGKLGAILHSDTNNTRIGIGVTSPQTTLDVNGSFRVRDLASCASFGTDSDGDFSCGGGEDSLWSFGSSTDVHYSHKVGVGTATNSSLGGKLNVEASSGTLLSLNATGSNRPVISFRDDGNEKVSAGYGSNGFNISVGGSSRMIIGDSGKVGIGNPAGSASSVLQVAGKVKIANGDGTCTEAGEMRYVAGHFYGCDGNRWLQLDGGNMPQININRSDSLSDGTEYVAGADEIYVLRFNVQNHRDQYDIVIQSLTIKAEGNDAASLYSNYTSAPFVDNNQQAAAQVFNSETGVITFNDVDFVIPSGVTKEFKIVVDSTAQVNDGDETLDSVVFSLAGVRASYHDPGGSNTLIEGVEAILLNGEEVSAVNLLEGASIVFISD